MASNKNNSKVSLLGDVSKSGQRATSPQRRASESSPQETSIKERLAEKIEPPPSRTSIWFKFMMLLGVLVVLGIIVIPKPQLIEYQVHGKMAQSVFLHEFGEQRGVLIDAPYTAGIDDERQEILLCSRYQRGVCQTYPIKKISGPVSSTAYVFEHYGPMFMFNALILSF